MSVCCTVHSVTHGNNCWHVIVSVTCRTEPSHLVYMCSSDLRVRSFCAAQAQRHVLAVIDIDSCGAAEVEPRLYSTYMRGWWPDPAEPPAHVTTEMATIVVSLQGPLLRYGQCLGTVNVEVACSDGASQASRVAGCCSQAKLGHVSASSDGANSTQEVAICLLSHVLGIAGAVTLV